MRNPHTTVQLFININSIVSSAQWHDEHHEDGGHEGEEDGVQTITKEMDMAHLEHAGFDPEAAAFEDGNDVEDLGYDEDPDLGAVG